MAKVKALVLAATGVVSGLSLGVGPAHAVAPFDVDLVAYLAKQADCDWVGDTGKTQKRWHEFDCDRLADGPYQGMWQLLVHRAGHDAIATPAGGPAIDLPPPLLPGPMVKPARPDLPPPMVKPIRPDGPDAKPGGPGVVSAEVRPDRPVLPQPVVIKSVPDKPVIVKPPAGKPVVVKADKPAGVKVNKPAGMKPQADKPPAGKPVVVKADKPAGVKPAADKPDRLIKRPPSPVDVGPEPLSTKPAPPPVVRPKPVWTKPVPKPDRPIVPNPSVNLRPRPGEPGNPAWPIIPAEAPNAPNAPAGPDRPVISANEARPGGQGQRPDDQPGRPPF
ncbi:hypothetical protein FB565_008018 [Actinoplanes lutulentus]|uniref:Uncharacterized protein n=1 Tax=Actinoplanes lutulentus TaxID=1287878 RepID=A0A327Z4W8_9ACTN|nr:hypothetical protein [Actinoplanes lutulentus]MBB2948235.1 hypothetical protein [Actinoplanes lutulentus]RAK31266.1 hypothetical protein B0I29_11572 [Actinoplanes lutulentus]